jgi:hypothetical protein
MASTPDPTITIQPPYVVPDGGCGDEISSCLFEHTQHTCGLLAVSSKRRGPAPRERRRARRLGDWLKVEAWAGPLLAAAFACASPHPTRPAATPAPWVIVSGVVVPAQPGETLYDLLRRAAPAHLRARDVLPRDSGAPSDPEIGVYIDGFFAGGVEALQTITARNTLSVRRFSSAETPPSYARKHSSGVLEVKLRR